MSVDIDFTKRAAHAQITQAAHAAADNAGSVLCAYVWSLNYCLSRNNVVVTAYSLQAARAIAVGVLLLPSIFMLKDKSRMELLMRFVSRDHSAEEEVLKLFTQTSRSEEENYIVALKICRDAPERGQPLGIAFKAFSWQMMVLLQDDTVKSASAAPARTESSAPAPHSKAGNPATAAKKKNKNKAKQISKPCAASNETASKAAMGDDNEEDDQVSDDEWVTRMSRACGRRSQSKRVDMSLTNIAKLGAGGGKRK